MWTLNEVPFKKLEKAIGDCWRIPLDHEFMDHSTYGQVYKARFSRQFIESRRKEVYVVRTPGGDWIVDFKFFNDSSEGWTVTGTFPVISVTPSVNIVGVYHGWLDQGILGDDLEGRTRQPAKQDPL